MSNVDFVLHALPRIGELLRVRSWDRGGGRGKVTEHQLRLLRQLDHTDPVMVGELAGAVFIVVLGSALHFTFAWSGYWRPAALVGFAVQWAVGGGESLSRVGSGLAPSHYWTWVRSGWALGRWESAD